MLNAAYEETDQSHWVIQTGIHAAAHAVLETEQHIVHTRNAITHTTTSVQGSDREVILVSNMHKLLSKIDDIPDGAVSN